MNELPSDLTPDGLPDHFASLVRKYRMQLEPADLIPYELQVFPAEEVVADAHWIIQQVEWRKRNDHR